MTKCRFTCINKLFKFVVIDSATYNRLQHNTNAYWTSLVIKIHFTVQSSSTKGNLPLFLACGHSMCESCVKNIVKFREPIECKVCHHDMVVHASQVALLAIDKLKLYQLFPVNYAMLGELAFQELQVNIINFGFGRSALILKGKYFILLWVTYNFT